MTDKLRAAAEMALEALKDMNCGWRYIRESHGDLYGVGWDRSQEKADDAIKALRQALDQLPDITKMMGLIPSEWAGLEEPPNSTTEFVEAEKPEAWPHKWGCRANAFGKCDKGCTAPPKREWVGLTQEDIDIAFDDTQEGGGFDDFARAIEAKLREKNGF